jgi:hypothetical protein
MSFEIVNADVIDWAARVRCDGHSGSGANAGRIGVTNAIKRIFELEQKITQLEARIADESCRLYHPYPQWPQYPQVTWEWDTGSASQPLQAQLRDAGYVMT